MNKVREQLVDRMIKVYGFEHEIVVEFAHLCEDYPDNSYTDSMLTTLVKCHEANPYTGDEDEE